MGLTHKEYLEKVEMSKVYMSLSKYVCEHDLFQQIKPEPILTVFNREKTQYSKYCYT